MAHHQLNFGRQLRRFAKSRFALSTVVTTLIVLVISVLLAGVVTYFAINVTSTRVQEESLALAKQHVWYDSVGSTAQAAIMVINTWGRDVVVDRITVRGQECDWSKVFYNTTANSIASDLFSNSTLVDGGTISIGGTNYVFKQASTDLTVQSGKTLIVYLANPDSISVNDIGLTVSLNIFTSQAMYYKETNVQGTSGTTTTSGTTGTMSLLNAAAYKISGDIGTVGLVLINAGSTAQSFDWNKVLVEGTLYPALYMYTWVGTTSVTTELPYFTAVSGGSAVVQTYTLNEQGASTITVQPGENAIVYFCVVTSDGYFSTVDAEITVGIKFDSGLILNQIVTVDAAS